MVDTDTVLRFDETTGAVVPTSGNPTFASLFSATGIAAGPDGNIYVATTNPGFNNNGVVNRYNASTGQQVGGAFVQYANDASQISIANGMTFGPSGNLFVADEGGNGAVQVFDAAGGYLASYVPQGGNPVAVAISPGLTPSLYVATSSTIERFDLTTHANTQIAQGHTGSFNNAVDLAFGPDGELYVLDSSSDTQVRQFNPDGTGETVFADFTGTTFQGHGMAFGPDGRLYVSGIDVGAPIALQGEIFKLSADGSSSTPLVTGLNYPGFFVFANVPEPTSLAAATSTLVLLRRRRRVV